MKRLPWKRFLILVFLTAAVIGAARVYFWMQGTLQPSEAALAALRSDNLVRVTQQQGLITFESLTGTPTTGFILYPGARVDYRSYAPTLRQIAEEGYLVFIPSMPFNIAFLNANAAGRIIAEHPEIKHWAVGGHSLGGVVAADFAVKHPEVDGVIFWASYPGNDSLRTANIKVLSISASLDGLATREKIESSRLQLPTDALFVVIEGGNHAQFGSYGPQFGDNPAAILPGEQSSQVAGITSEFLLSISK